MLARSAVIVLIQLTACRSQTAAPTEEVCTDAAIVMLQHHAEGARQSRLQQNAAQKECEPLHLQDLDVSWASWCDPKYNPNPPPKKLQGLFYQNILPEGETMMCWSLATWNATERSMLMDVPTAWVWNHCGQTWFITYFAKVFGAQLKAVFTDDTLTQSTIYLQMNGVMGSFLNTMVSHAFNALMVFDMSEVAEFSANNISNITCDSPGDCWLRPTYLAGQDADPLYTYRPMRVIDGDMVMNKQYQDYLLSDTKVLKKGLSVGSSTLAFRILTPPVFWLLGMYDERCPFLVTRIQCVSSMWDAFRGLVFPWNWR